ncbi:hypothetical protein D3C78_1395100 [compost metagenome]
MVPSDYLSLPIAKMYFIKHMKNEKKKLVSIPRVKFHNIVLSRRQWWVPATELPEGIPSDDLEKCFNFERWRQSKQLPNKFFVRVLNVGSDTQNKGEKEPEDISSSKDSLRKPQYIDCNSLFFIKTFEKYCILTRNKNGYLIIEEFLPDQDSLLIHGENGQYISEFIVEVNKRKKGKGE